MSTGNLLFSYSPINLKRYLDDSFQARYLISYLNDLSCRTCILEDNYVDKDYLIDYQKFYARSFSNEERYTKRIHFLTNDFSEPEFEESLKTGNITSLQKSYLGFIVVRPIKGSDRNRLIGRTILKSYPMKIGDERRIFIKNNNEASLFGMPLSVESLPFQVQDHGVSACATIALWVALYPLTNAYGLTKYSPAEITDIATNFPSELRKFPSIGLTWEQMIAFIKHLDLDVETINIDKSDPNIVPLAIKAFINARYPLIGALTLTGPGKESLYHAVVISGYRYDVHGNLKELYVHDDTIGPYSRVKSSNNFINWENEWKDRGYEVTLEKLLIPIYSKVRLTFTRIYYRYGEIKGEIVKSRADLDLELLLYTVQDYKNYLLGKQLDQKFETLTKPLPRFLWVIRAYIKENPIFDVFYDGTSIYPQDELIFVEFR